MFKTDERVEAYGSVDELTAFVVFYLVFKFAIVKFDLKTPGREDEDAEMCIRDRCWKVKRRCASIELKPQ